MHLIRTAWPYFPNLCTYPQNIKACFCGPEIMTVYHDEVEIEDFEYDEDQEVYYYPCPCGDQFQISKAELTAGEEEATCPSCSLVIKVIYDKEAFAAKQEELAKTEEKELVAQEA